MPSSHHFCPPHLPMVGGRIASCGNAVRPDGLHEWLLMVSYHGACRLDHGAGRSVFPVGQAVLVEPHVRHDYGPADDRQWDVRWVVFAPPSGWREWLRWPASGPGIRHAMISDHVIRTRVGRHLDAACELAAGGTPWHSALAMNALEAALLWCTGNVESQEQVIDPRLRRAIDHLRQQHERDLSVTEVAEVAGLSAPQFTRLFRRQLGQSPHAFLEDHRLERAAQLLRISPLTVHAISTQCGYPNAFYFSTRFKRRFAATPSAYRARSNALHAKVGSR